uniref:Uncharacterized protein n=1 Tax=Meloidogyne enterolobii TaxID=390850 RepID=A0A6V7X2G1_MELEN|nr:unnamed protein product [Meloidogyne enterolobii]
MSAEENQLINGSHLIHLTNRWIRIDEAYTCCNLKCINSNIANGICYTNGFVRVENDFSVRYFSTGDHSRDAAIIVYAENGFSREAALDVGYSLFYYEVTLTKMDNLEEDSFLIGLGEDNLDVYLMSNENSFTRKNIGRIPFDHNWSINDVIGCGIVYPPPYKKSGVPYVFFTINGSKIGKAIGLDYYTKNLIPMIRLERCSVTTNFGQDDFRYDANNHILHGEDMFGYNEWSDFDSFDN